MPDVHDCREAYLNDHLAGAQGGLELLEGLRKSEDERPAALAGALHGDITADRAQLEMILDRLGIPDHRLKRAVASVAASTARIARIGVPEPVLRLLEVEAVTGGILAKQRLWQALLAAPSLERSIADIDLEELSARADSQLERLEVEHRRLATAALDAARSPT